MKSFLTPPPDLFSVVMQLAPQLTLDEAGLPFFTAGELATADSVALATDEVGAPLILADPAERDADGVGAAFFPVDPVELAAITAAKARAPIDETVPDGGAGATSSWQGQGVFPGPRWAQLWRLSPDGSEGAAVALYHGRELPPGRIDISHAEDDVTDGVVKFVSAEPRDRGCLLLGAATVAGVDGALVDELMERLRDEPEWEAFIKQFGAYNAGPAGAIAAREAITLVLGLGFSSKAAPGAVIPTVAGVDGALVDGALVDELMERLRDTPEWEEFINQFGAYNAESAGALAAREAIILALRLGLISTAAPGATIPAAATPSAAIHTPYANTGLPAVAYPGDLQVEGRLMGAMRWNAAAMVARANKDVEGIGGHIATGQSNAVMEFELLTHFLQAEREGHGGDVFFIQGHDAPNCYAYEHLLGNLSDELLPRFRRTVDGKGLESYPHAQMMPGFWHVSSVSMGLAPQLAVRYAQFMRYARDHGLYQGPKRHIWCVLGDGSLAEPETWGDLDLPVRLGLDNLTFVINANLIGLDQPVMPNDQIVQLTAARFRGHGWNVIKLVFGGSWDPLIAADTQGLIAKRMGALSDGDLQRLTRSDGATIRSEFFGLTRSPTPAEREQIETGTFSLDTLANPALLALVQGLSDNDLVALFKDWGGHDPIKVHQAFRAAFDHKGGPTVVIAMTIKGRDMGSVEGGDDVHSEKKMTAENARVLRDRLGVPLSDEAAERFDLVPLSGEDAAYLLARRAELGGAFFRERHGVAPLVSPPEAKPFEDPKRGSVRSAPATVEGVADPALTHYLTDVLRRYVPGERLQGATVASTTVVYGALLRALMRDPNMGRAIVPIIADEAKTFGLINLLNVFGEYDPRLALFLSMRKGRTDEIKIGPTGRTVQVGISESAALSLFTAAGIEGMIPFFIGYSAFFPRRVADQMMAAADMRARGFFFGATAGGSTLNGEGTQHQERADHLKLVENERVLPYDPAFGFELAVLIEEYLGQMIRDGRRIMPYINVYNEDYPHPAVPKGLDPKALAEGILHGLYPFAAADTVYGPAGHPVRRAQILSSGSIMMQALKAQAILKERFGVYADVWSATSYVQLMRDARRATFKNRHHPERATVVPYVARMLGSTPGPIVAASDYMRSLPDLVAPWLDVSRYHVVGTDGYGRSDTRPVLRDFYGIDAAHIVYEVLLGLYHEGQMTRHTARGPAARRRQAAAQALPPFRLDELLAARAELGINPDAPYPPETPAF